jgi:hypothetical protein
MDTELIPQTPQTRVIEIGCDQVTISENEVVIDAAREMPDWQVREFKPTPIYFEDKKYLLFASNRAQRPFARRYILKPWPAEHLDAAKNFFTYDAESIAERDGAHREGVKTEGVRIALTPFYPFLGLLWSGTQRRLERIGFVSRSLTSISIYATFALCFAQMSCAAVLINSSIRSGKLALGGIIRLFAGSDTISVAALSIPAMWLDVLLLLALITDVLVRYSFYLREDQWCGGFLEWLVRRAPKVEKDEA